MTPKAELMMLLQERTLSNWDRRHRRLLRIPMDVVGRAVGKAFRREPLTLEEFIAANLGFLPGERERLEQLKGRPGSGRKR